MGDAAPPAARGTSPRAPNPSSRQHRPAGRVASALRICAKRRPPGRRRRPNCAIIPDAALQWNTRRILVMSRFMCQRVLIPCCLFSWMKIRMRSIEVRSRRSRRPCSVGQRATFGRRRVALAAITATAPAPCFTDQTASRRRSPAACVGVDRRMSNTEIQPTRKATVAPGPIDPPVRGFQQCFGVRHPTHSRKRTLLPRNGAPRRHPGTSAARAADFARDLRPRQCRTVDR